MHFYDFIGEARDFSSEDRIKVLEIGLMSTVPKFLKFLLAALTAKQNSLLANNERPKNSKNELETKNI